VTAPLWLWPNLLSLDAPLVALAWQILFGLCFHSGLRWVPAVLLALAVWVIYAADHMLDAWRGAAHEPRHEFYRRHWHVMLPVWCAAVAGAAILAFARLDPGLIRRGIALSVAVIVYLAIVHLASMRLRRLWPKEAAVAVLFALGSSLAAWPQVRSAADVATIVLFTCLCWINCRAIDSWERAERRPAWPVGALALGVAAAALLLLPPHRPILCCAETASALAFIYLDRSRMRLSANALRVLADVALLSPLPLLPLVGMRG
jgi:hypothetical protein